MTVELPTGASVATARRLIAQAFRRQGLDSPELDARLLVARALRLDHTGLIAAADRVLSPDEIAILAPLVERRLQHEPIARITGEKEFWGLLLKLNSATLAPRPETETVVEAALAAIEAAGMRDRPFTIADLGTGTGALLLALVSELPRAHGIGTDMSIDALRLARENAARHRLAARTSFVACD